MVNGHPGPWVGAFSSMVPTEGTFPRNAAASWTSSSSRKAQARSPGSQWTTHGRMGVPLAALVGILPSSCKCKVPDAARQIYGLPEFETSDKTMKCSFENSHISNRPVLCISSFLLLETPK